MGGACSTYGEKKSVYRFLVRTSEGKRPLEEQGVDGKIILRWIFRKWDVGVWTGSRLAQDRDRWRALVNREMNLRVP